MSVTVGTPRGKLRMQCGIVCICNFCRFFAMMYVSSVMSLCQSISCQEIFPDFALENTTIKDDLCVLAFFRQASEFQCWLQVFFKICSSICIKKVWNFARRFAWKFASNLCKHGWKFVASSSANFRSWLKVWYNPLKYFAANFQAPCKQGQSSFAWNSLFARALRPSSLGYRCLWRGLLLPFQIARVLSKIFPQLPLFFNFALKFRGLPITTWIHLFSCCPSATDHFFELTEAVQASHWPRVIWNGLSGFSRGRLVVYVAHFATQECAHYGVI